MRAPFALVLGILLAGCVDRPAQPHPSATPPEGPAEPAPTSSPPSPSTAATRDFGAPIDETLALTPLSEILAAPDAHASTLVRTRGTVHRVCQRMGCWMELREGDGPAVRVPMSGHAFFLPRDCQGQAAEVQGRVVMQALTPEARAHLGSEGATALASLVSIDAVGVRLGAP